MKVGKLLMIVIAVTFLSLLYVYQQTRIIHMAYHEQEQLAYLNKQVAKNDNLRFHMNRQMSLVSIAQMWQEEDFEWPHADQLISLSTPGETIEEDDQQAEQSESILAGLFGLKSQAEATSINSR